MSFFAGNLKETEREIRHSVDLNLNDIVTPVNAALLKSYLTEANYPQSEIDFLYSGFMAGFTIGYQGPIDRANLSKNIPFKAGIGDEIELWNKIMIEVEANRVACPFTDGVPYINFMQSPIGLVPKHSDKTRMIFHLSYNFSEKSCDKSLNHFTPKHMCMTKYNNLDYAVQTCMRLRGGDLRHPLVLAKTNLVSAFRMLPILPEHHRWLIFKATNPSTGKVCFFADKCLPFGTSVSCSHYQHFSNALKTIIEHWTNKQYSVTNYLDDFLFIEYTRSACNEMVRKFFHLCNELGVPIALEKTEWGSDQVVFLGILVDGKNLMLRVPVDKKDKALRLLNHFSSKKKATVNELQQLTGFLNFLTKAIFPGRAFTRRMYSKYSHILDDKNGKYKKYHHVRLDREFKFNCQVWQSFLSGYEQALVSRPMLDVNKFETSTTIGFYTDSSGNAKLGFGGIFGSQWFFGQWEPGYIATNEPSITYLELFALTTGVLIWSKTLSNCRIVIHCDNQSVVEMVNNTTSSCYNCMFLI